MHAIRYPALPRNLGFFATPRLAPILSKTTQENLEHANSALAHVREILPYGACNRPSAHPEAYTKVYLAKSLSNIMLHVFCITGLFYSAAPATVRASSFASTLMQAGNCAGQAAVARMYLRERGVFNVDYVYLENGDHVFLIIGRAKNSNIEDPTTWGENAVICDPWANTCYLNNHVEAKLDTILRDADYGRFDSKKHKIKIIPTDGEHGHGALTLLAICHFLLFLGKALLTENKPELSGADYHAQVRK